MAAAIAGCGGGSLDGGGAGASGSIGGRGGPGTGAGASAGNTVGSGATSGFTGGGASSGTTGVGAVTGGAAFSGTSGSIAGSGGRGAIGGSGAIGGTGATAGIAGGGEPCPFLQTPVCGREACGNGRRDTCLSPFGPGCMLGQVTEVCDLDDGPPSMTCTELGYASGATGCAADCSGIDMTGCHECFPLQAPVVGCGIVPVGLSTTSWQIGLAATDAEIGLVWVDTSPLGAEGVGFAQLAPDLTPIRSRVVERFPEPTPYDGPVVDGVAVAPLPTGWVVAVVAFAAVTDTSELYLHVLDTRGQVVARTTVEVGSSRYAFIDIPVLVPRPGGGPLILWTSPYGAHAAVIAADGRSVGVAVDLPTNVLFVDGFWVQDAFTIVIKDFNLGISVKALRVDGAGRVVSTRELFAGDAVGEVGAAVGADDLRVIFNELLSTPPYAGVTVFQRFTAAGEPLSERKMISHPDVTFVSGVRAIARGTDTTVLFSQAGSIRHGWVTPDGDLQPAAHAIAQSPDGIYPSAITRRGADIVLGWTASNPVSTQSYYPGSTSMHISMARLAP